MSGLILPDELESLDVDVSVPIFISINPDGSLGLNYLGLTDNALAQPQPRYHGIVDYRNLVIGQPIVPSSGVNANLNSGDLIVVTADNFTIAPTFPTLFWHLIAYVAGTQNPPPYRWYFLGGSDKKSVDLTNALESAINDGNWHVCPGVNTITVPATGTYEFWMEGIAQISAAGGREVQMAVQQNATVPLNGTRLIGVQSAAASLVTGGGKLDNMQFNAVKGDVLTLMIQGDSANNSGWINPGFGIRPVYLLNIQ